MTKPVFFEEGGKARDPLVIHGFEENIIGRKVAYLTGGEHGESDCDGYLGGDLPVDHRIQGNHSHVYIAGSMRQGSSVMGSVSF